MLTVKKIPYIVFLMLLAGCGSPEQGGKEKAEEDIRNGTVTYKIYGELHPYEVFVFPIIEEKYKIKIERVAGCVIEETDCRFWDTYNRTIEEKYLKEEFSIIEERARKKYLESPIGTAFMTEDKTIVLNLRAESLDGAIGHAQFSYPPDHPEYKEILEHLGGLEPGEEKLVPPWTENEPANQAVDSTSEAAPQP